MKGACAVSLPLVIKKFIEELDQLAINNFPTEAITHLFNKSLFNEHILEPFSFFSQMRYLRNLLHKTNDYELLLLCWMPGQKSPIHGHEGEKCWMRVEYGELYFTNYHLTEHESKIIVEPHNSITGKKGFVDGPAVIHAVENKTTAPAVSLHLYARPFAQCDIFDKENQSKARIDLKYDSVLGKRMNF